MTYMSCVKASESKWRNTAVALAEVTCTYSRIEGTETHLTNCLEDGKDFDPDTMAGIDRDLLELQERARCALSDLRKVGVIVSEPGTVEIHLPRLSEMAEGDDPTEHAIYRAGSSLTNILCQLSALEDIQRTARNWALPSRSYVAPESELDGQRIEQKLLMIDHMVPAALAEIKKLLELAPVD